MYLRWAFALIFNVPPVGICTAVGAARNRYFLTRFCFAFFVTPTTTVLPNAGCATRGKEAFGQKGVGPPKSWQTYTMNSGKGGHVAQH